MIRPVLSSLKRLLADRLELKPLSAVDRLGDAPLCSGALTDRDGYMALFDEARKKAFPEVDDIMLLQPEN